MASILLLDDQKLVAESLARQLARMGHSVTALENGLVGISAFAKGNFDLVITDILMPEQDGLGFITAARRLNARTPIIAMTGDHMASSSSGHGYDYLMMAQRLGAAATIRKPFRRSQLCDLVDWCLRGSGGSRETFRP